jgi:hypothetical protein
MQRLMNVTHEVKQPSEVVGLQFLARALLTQYRSKRTNLRL